MPLRPACVLLSILLAGCAELASTEPLMPTDSPLPPAPSPSSPPPAAPAGSGWPIVQTGAPVLRARATEVPPERIQTAEFQALIAAMTAAMREAPGVGLAAPQIGVPLRVIVLEDRAELSARLSAEERQERERTPFTLRVFINPVLTPIGDEKRIFFEGCLSVKGYAALVERSAEVSVTGLDEHGQPQTMHVRGWPARILQHEVDHLDGTLYIDRMMSRSFATMEQAKTLYGGKPIAEIRRLLGL